MGIFLSFAEAMTSFIFFSLPILPGFIRKQSTPLFSTASAIL
jgi:hypothetical protein